MTRVLKNELTHLQNNIEEIRQEGDSSQREESVTKAIDEESDKQGNVQKLVNQYQPTWVQVGQVKMSDR